MFDAYTEKMPNWLKIEAKKEIKLFESMIKKINKTTSVLDIGCGDCRIFKLPIFNSIVKYGNCVACDIFKKKELPEHFKNWLIESNIRYVSIPTVTGYTKNVYTLPSCIGRFDIITCFGVDLHLNYLELSQYLYSAFLQLKNDGIILWQKNNFNSSVGKKLLKSEGERAINNVDIDYYIDYVLDLKCTYKIKKTDLSYIIQIRKNKWN